ncbi:MAG: HDIG domain-containing metalloprotein [Bacteroidota bacterium]
MKKLIHLISNQHDWIYKILLILIAFSSIVAVLPKEGKFKYEFQKGKRWMNKDLEAPFDFGIQKTTDEINSEKKSILENIRPFYREDTIIIKKVNDDFESQFEQKSNLIKPSNYKGKLDSSIVNLHKFIGKSIIDSIYNVGFIEVNAKYSNTFISLLRNNKAADINKSSLYNTLNVNNLLSNNCLSLYSGKIDYNKVDTSFIKNVLQNILVPSIFIDEETTNKLIDDDLQGISPSKGLIKKGDLIISKGSIVNSEKFQVLNSLKYEYEQVAGYTFNYFDVLIGQSLIVLVCLLVLLLFLFTFRRDIFNNNRLLLFIFIMVFLSIYAARIVLKINYLPIYFVPFCILPIIIRVFFDTRLALFVHLVTTLIIGYMVPNAFEFIFLQIIAGIIAIISVVNFRTRSHLFFTAMVLFVVYSIVYVGNSILQDNTYQNIKWENLVWFGVNAFLTLFAYPLMYVFERIFGFVSDIILLELSDTNNKLLRELAEKAPGTFQHSLQVANLAEEAIYQIGGNALLVRTGALYHDIGKMDMPLFFIENQITGMNPHDEISFDESAKIIISHVIKGIEIAKKHNLPEIIIDFIRTHHGTSRVQYFYQSFVNDFPEEEVDENAFTYKGPIPYSRETAILMMADSIEAASRTLGITTPEAIDELIDKIIKTQMSINQYINADITFKDITKIKRIFKKRLINAYHVRIEYPS